MKEKSTRGSKPPIYKSLSKKAPISEDSPPTTRPRLLNNSQLSSVPTKDEWLKIVFLEEEVTKSKTFYAGFHGHKFLTATEKGQEITPTQYLDFLARTYEAYESENCKIFPHREAQYSQNIELMKSSMIRHKALDVNAYSKRPNKSERPIALSGDLVGYDHVPPTSLVKEVYYPGKLEAAPGLERSNLTARAIPEVLHKEFHEKVPELPQDLYEAANAQLKWQRPGLEKRGYSQKQILESEDAVHKRNKDRIYSR